MKHMDHTRAFLEPSATSPTSKRSSTNSWLAGRRRCKAYVAVMRKLLHAIYGMVATEMTFVPEKFHAAA
jgi:hypothetical protein